MSGKMLGWWSKRTDEVLVAMDAKVAVAIENWLMGEIEIRLCPPVATQLRDQIQGALRECPPEKR